MDTLLGAKGTTGAGMFAGLGDVFSKIGGLVSVGSVTAATGGLISGPGTSTSDSIPARLSDGEFVVNAAATRANVNLLHAINSTGRTPAFAAGGMVGGMPVNGSGGASAGGDTHIHVQVNGATGNTEIHQITHAAVTSALASYDKALPGRMAERQRRTG